MKKYKNIVIILIVVGVGLGVGFLVRNNKHGESVRREEKLSIFTDSENRFSFSYPENMKVTEADLTGVEGGKRVLVESGEGEINRGFEIIILPFDESGQLTQERILADIPDMEMNNVKNISVGKNVPALSFESTDENLGKTFEIWFISAPQARPVGEEMDGYLMQARTYPEFGAEMERILKTLK